MAGDAIVAGFYEHFEKNDLDAAVELFSEELETVDPGMGTVHGIEPFREYLETFKRAMPDARAIIEQQYESGDTVIVEGRFVGTHTGPLAGDDGDIEPTGKSVDLRFADISRLSDGKIASYHTYYDQVGLLTQLGVMDDS
jgi:ketosteroid isomerase-like protein